MRPDPALHADFVEVLDEFAAVGEYPHGSGIVSDEHSDGPVKGPLWRADALRDVLSFIEYCEEMRRRADPAYALSLGLVPDEKLWLVEDLRLLGFL